jgi:hypothetical protein
VQLEKNPYNKAWSVPLAVEGCSHNVAENPRGGYVCIRVRIISPQMVAMDTPGLANKLARAAGKRVRRAFVDV